MKRTILFCLAVLCLVPLPARADSVTGRIEVPAAHPGIPRALYLAQGEAANGVAGYVIPLTASTSERRFDLRLLAGSTKADEDLDAWFYRDIRGTGEPCPRVIDSAQDGGETGVICADAEYAVIVLFAGAGASFVFTA